MIEYFKELLEIVQILVDSLITGRGLNINELEIKIRRLGIILMKVIFIGYIYILDKRIKTEICPKCQKKIKERKKFRTLKTLFGCVNFKRVYKNCENCNNKEFPVDKEIKIEGKMQITTGLRKLGNLCGISWSYEDSEKVITEVIGEQVISGREIEAITQTIGLEIKEHEENELNEKSLKPVEEIPEIIYVDTDGGMINHKKEGKSKEKDIEGKVCSIWSVKGLISKNRHKIFDKEYLGTFNKYTELEWQIFLAVMSRTRDIRKTLVVIRGDGAEWIKTIAEDNFPKSVYLLDWYHLVKKVHERLKQIIKDPKEREELAGLIKDELYKGMAEDVIIALKMYEEYLTTDFEKYWLNRFIAYLFRNKEGIWYEQAHNRGIDIGTGNAEKNVDIAICRRLKQRGMSWNKNGAEAVLKARISFLNNSWENFWKDRYNVS